MCWVPPGSSDEAASLRRANNGDYRGLSPFVTDVKSCAIPVVRMFRRIKQLCFETDCSGTTSATETARFRAPTGLGTARTCTWNPANQRGIKYVLQTPHFHIR
eukprot:scaffold609911_cov42-Prasinocladus_malaysianus.AAC.1